MKRARARTIDRLRQALQDFTAVNDHPEQDGIDMETARELARANLRQAERDYADFFLSSKTER